MQLRSFSLCVFALALVATGTFAQPVYYRRVLFFAHFNAGVRAVDRANTGVHILRLTGAARESMK